MLKKLIDALVHEEETELNIQQTTKTESLSSSKYCIYVIIM